MFISSQRYLVQAYPEPRGFLLAQCLLTTQFPPFQSNVLKFNIPHDQLEGLLNHGLPTSTPEYLISRSESARLVPRSEWQSFGRCISNKFHHLTSDVYVADSGPHLKTTALYFTHRNLYAFSCHQHIFKCLALVNFPKCSLNERYINSINPFTH